MAPTFWLNPQNGVSYPIVAQTPQYRHGLAVDLQQHAGHQQQRRARRLLGGIATIHRDVGDAVVSHYDIEPLFDVYATTQGRDLGAVAGDIQNDRA